MDNSSHAFNPKSEPPTDTASCDTPITHQSLYCIPLQYWIPPRLTSPFPSPSLVPCPVNLTLRPSDPQVVRGLDSSEVAASEHTTHTPGALQPSVTGSTSFLSRAMGGPASAGSSSSGGGGGLGARLHYDGTRASLDHSVSPYTASAAAEGGGGRLQSSPLLQRLGADGLVSAPQPRPAGVRCLLPLSSGHLITGNSDRCAGD